MAAQLPKWSLAHCLLMSSLLLLAEPAIPLGSRISPQLPAWLSPGGRFSFGFLPDYRQSDGGFLLGTWHNFDGVPDRERTLLWAVGDRMRVSPNSTFLLSLDGCFHLYDARSSATLPIWTTPTASSRVRLARLLDTGNLVLLDSAQNIVWQSFDSPTDTLLPGQPLRFPCVLSTNSMASYYMLKIRSSGELALVWESNVTYWTAEPRLPLAVMEARLQADGMFGLFDATGRFVWYRLSEDFRDPAVKFRRLTVDPDGNLRMYSWAEGVSSWVVGWQAVQNQCDVFGSCGLYSVCGYNASRSTCECLSQHSGSEECEKMSDLGNCETALSMSVLKQTVLYSLYPPHDVDLMLGLDACKEQCMKDRYCFAATALNDGSGRCTVKRSSFISGFHYSSVHATSFLKVCLVPEAVSAQAAKLHGYVGNPFPTPSSLSGNIRHKNILSGVAILLLATAFVFLTVEMFIFWFVWNRRRKRVSKRSARWGSEMNPLHSGITRLSFNEVEGLTKNFANRLGQSTYRGSLLGKMPVIFKLLDKVDVSERSFQMMMSTLGSIHHKNLVALKGFCFESQNQVLVYEYISNGSLDQWLHRKKQSRGWDTWRKRLDVATGVARGLAYLHLECKQCIAHGNLKPGNILLDDHLASKLTYFGLHNLTKDVASSSETLSEKDIYVFGEILLEIVSGRIDTSKGDLHDLAFKACETGTLLDFVDDHLDGTVEPDSAARVLKLALWCMQNQPSLRPCIGEVVMVLDGALSLDMPPLPHSPARLNDRTLGSDGNMDIITVSP